MIALSKAVAGALVANAGSVIDKAGLAHPVLGYIIIEPARPGDVTFRAAGQAAHAVWEGPEAGELAEPFAIQHAHLAKLHALMPAGTALHIDAQRTSALVTLRRGEAAMGSWTLPTASASTIAYFPPEPTPEPGGDPETFRARDLVDALSQVAWLTEDDTPLQIIDGATVVASSWSAAHQVTMPHRPPYTGVTVLPGRGARVLRTVLPRDGRDSVTWHTDEHFHHVTFQGARLHLVKWNAAVENVRARFFPPVDAADFRVAGGALAPAVARASALSDAVDLGPGFVDGTGVVRASAADGSSVQVVNADVDGDALKVVWPAPMRFQAAQLGPTLAAFHGEFIDVARGSTGTVIFSDADQAVALVPLATVAP